MIENLDSSRLVGRNPHLRRIVIFVIVTVVAIGFGCGLGRRAPTRYIVPFPLVQTLELHWGVVGASPLPYDGEYQIADFTVAPIIFTSDEFTSGFASDEMVYPDPSALNQKAYIHIDMADVIMNTVVPNTNEPQFIITKIRPSGPLIGK